jgi:DNA-binding winged helix-turn-helix (wHTH) protein
MSEQARVTGVWLFAGCLFDPSTGLSHGDNPVPLSRKPQRLLEVLLQANGAVVSRENIALALWGTAEVANASIERCIYLLRRALRTATGADLIATHYGQGLQFKGQVIFQSGGKATGSDRAARTSEGWHGALGMMRVGRTSLEQMQTRLEQMIAASDDPSPAALVAAATLIIGRIVRGHVPPLEGRRRMVALAEAALAATPNFAPALAIKAFASAVLDRDLAEARPLADQAVELEPTMALPRFSRSWVMVVAREPEAARAEVAIGLKFSPVERMLQSMDAPLRLASDSLAAIRPVMEERLLVRPDLDSLSATLSIIHSLSGRHEEAIAAAHRAVEVSEGDLYLQTFLAYAHAKAGHDEAAEAILARLGDPVRDFHAPSMAAPALLALGRADDALQAISAGFAVHEPSTFLLEYDLRLKPLWPEIARLRAQMVALRA